MVVDNTKKPDEGDALSSQPSSSSSSPSSLQQQQTTTVNISTEHHPIACIRCRKLHKKCDKKLNGCSKCASAGVECVFNTPQKRGKGSEMYAKTKASNNKISNEDSSNNKISKKDKPIKKRKTTTTTSSADTSNTSNGSSNISTDNHHQSNNNSNNSNSSSINSNSSSATTSKLTPNQLVDLYFTHLCGIHPLIEREKLKYFVNNCLSQCEDKKKTELYLDPNNVWINSIEEMKCIYAFYLALCATGSQMLSDINSADKYIRMAELEIALLSIDHSTQFYWAAACHYTFIFYIGDGCNYKSGYYLTKVSYYIETTTKKDQIILVGSSSERFFRTLQFHSGIVSSKFKDEESYSFLKIMEGMSNMFYFYTNKRIADILLPGTWEYCMNTKLCQENFILFKQVSEFIFKTLGTFKMQAIKNLTDCHSDNFFKAQRLFTLFIAETFTILLMKQIPDLSYHILEESTLKISLLTENEMYPYLLLSTIHVVVDVAEFHLDICKQIEQQTKPRKATVMISTGKVITFDYFSILAKDLRALELLAKRYRRVTRLYGNLIQEIAQLLARNVNNINNSNLYSPLTFSEQVLPPFLPPIQQMFPQKDEILTRQVEEQQQTLNKEEEADDSVSFLSDHSLGPWEQLFQ